MTTSPRLRFALDRSLLEHPRAFHLRRMRAALWLYLVLVAQIARPQVGVPIDPPRLAERMGVPEGTIRSWLGHLRKHGYIRLSRAGKSVVAQLRHVEPAVPEQTDQAPVRFFSIPKLESALGESGYRESLQGALVTHNDAAVQRSLAAALAVPAAEIRRSRTALFLYFLKRHAQSS